MPSVFTFFQLIAENPPRPPVKPGQATHNTLADFLLSEASEAIVLSVQYAPKSYITYVLLKKAVKQEKRWKIMALKVKSFCFYSLFHN